MRPVSVFANVPGGEIEQLHADLRDRWRQATRAVVVLAEDETHLNLLPHVRASWTV
jgi:hypothetical protein